MKSLLREFFLKDRKALAKVITLFESKQENDFLKAKEVAQELNKVKTKSIRIGVSGPPGVGKSTFINALGQICLKENFKIAVLAIDPSSELSGGSLLGDKIRMPDLSKSSHAFVRPSPSKCSLGGVAISTKDVIFSVEAFGFDIVIIETVGVGQTESVINSLVDHFILLIQPGAGDEIQAIKKGNIELADFLLVNKTDGDLENLAKKTFYGLKSDYKDKAFSISAKENIGISEIWQIIKNRQQDLIDKNILLKKRAKRGEEYLKYIFFEELKYKINSKKDFQENIKKLSRVIEDKKQIIRSSIDLLLKEYL